MKVSTIFNEEEISPKSDGVDHNRVPMDGKA